MPDQRDLELAVLSAALRNRGALDTVITALDGYPFSESTLQWVWETFKAIRARKEMPSSPSLLALVEAEPAAATEALLETLVEVKNASPSAAPATDCDTLHRLAKRGRISKGVDSAVQALIRGDLDGAASTMVKAGANAIVAGRPLLQVASVLDWMDWNNTGPQIQTSRPVPTGIRRLDDSMDGGMNRKELGLIFSVTNMGKSILSVNFGHAAVKLGFRVLHIDTENGLDTLRYRYTARFVRGLGEKRHPTNSLRRRKSGYSDVINLWALNKKAELDEKIRLSCVGVDQTSQAELEARVESLIAEGFVPDLIILDSPDQLSTDPGDNIALALKRRYEWMKGWIQKLNAVGWVVTQADEKAAGRTAVTKDVAWARDKVKLADVAITINPGLDAKGKMLAPEVMDGERSLFVAKARQAKARYSIRLVTDFATAYMAEDLDS